MQTTLHSMPRKNKLWKYVIVLGIILFLIFVYLDNNKSTLGLDITLKDIEIVHGSRREKGVLTEYTCTEEFTAKLCSLHIGCKWVSLKIRPWNGRTQHVQFLLIWTIMHILLGVKHLPNIIPFYIDMNLFHSDADYLIFKTYVEHCKIVNVIPVFKMHIQYADDLDSCPNDIDGILNYIAGCSNNTILCNYETDIIRTMMQSKCFTPNIHNNELSIGMAYIRHPGSDEIISRLKSMALVNSIDPSFGTQLWHRAHSVLSKINIQFDMDYNIFVELDGRLSNIIKHNHVKSAEGYIVSEIQQGMQSKPLTKLMIDKIILINKYAYFKGILSNGQMVFLSPIYSNYTRKEYITNFVLALFNKQLSVYKNQGVAELVSYWVDNIIGLGRTAVSTYRQIHVTAKCQISMYSTTSCPNLSIYIPGISISTSMVPYLRRFIQHSGVHSYLNFVMIGAVKEMQDINKFSHYDKAILKAYFSHEISLEKILSAGWSLQTLKDLSDIFIFHFLINNPDYKEKNLKYSEGRVFAFDNGLAFWETTDCPGLLHCPSLICGLWCFVRNDRKHKFCRFQKSTVDLLKYNKNSIPSLGDKLNSQLKKYKWLAEFERGGYFGSLNDDFTKALDQRLCYILEYIVECENLMKNNVYL